MTSAGTLLDSTLPTLFTDLPEEFNKSGTELASNIVRQNTSLIYHKAFSEKVFSQTFERSFAFMYSVVEKTFFELYPLKRSDMVLFQINSLIVALSDEQRVNLLEQLQDTFEITRISSTDAPSTQPISTKAIKSFSPLYVIDEIYLIDNTTQVFAFLEEHPDLIDVLLEAYSTVEKFFESGIQIELKVVSDPESENSETLFGYILTTLSPDDALAKLEAFDDEWLLNLEDKTKGNLNFNIRFL